MAEEEKNKIEKELEEKKKKEESMLSNIPPIVILLIAGTFLIAFFFLKLTNIQWVLFILIALVIIYLSSITSSSKLGYLMEEDAKKLLNEKIDKKKTIGEVPQNWRHEIGLVSALPHIDGVQREYFIPFLLIDENNIPKTWVARMDRVTGNTTYAECPEGFMGTERPTIRHVLPEDLKIIKRMGLEKSIWRSLFFR